MQKSRNPSHMEVAFQQLEAHMLFICPECGETFQNQIQWRQHLNFHHDYLCKKPEDFGFTEVNDRFHECKTCNVMVADGKRAIALLQYHRFLHLPHSRTYRCRHCPASFTRKRVLCEHLCRSHERIVGEKVTDSATKKLFTASSQKAGDQTKNGASSNAKDNLEFYMRYICPQCGKQIENYEKWVMHIKCSHAEAVRSDCEMQRVSGTKNYYCKICRKVIFSSDSSRLQRHYYSHMPYKVAFQCAYCKVRRAYKMELLHHFIRTHIKEFDLQRKYIKKPLEWGADINELLDKELDLLLQYGSGLSSIKGPNSMQFTSTTISNSYSQNMRLPTRRSLAQRKQKNDKEQNLFNSLLGVETDTTAVPTRYKDKYSHEIGGSTGKRTEKRSWEGFKQKATQSQRKNSTELNQNQNQNQNKTHKNELEALCAEIFGDIDMETELVSQTAEISNIKNNNSLNDIPENSQEEIVSIEINPLDENDLNQLNETEIHQSEENLLPKKRQKLSDSVEIPISSTAKSKHYPTLKSLFNAKILHLCPKCGISFGEQSAWRDHVLTAHENLSRMIDDNYKFLEDQDSNLCLNCMQVLATTNKSELQRHCFTHMPYHSYLKCTLCGTSKSNKSKMLNHLETEHGSLLQSNAVPIETTDDNSAEHFLKDVEIKREEDQDKTASTHLKKGEFSHLMKHLLDARERLNRIAAGTESF